MVKQKSETGPKAQQRKKQRLTTTWTKSSKTQQCQEESKSSSRQPHQLQGCFILAVRSFFDPLAHHWIIIVPQFKLLTKTFNTSKQSSANCRQVELHNRDNWKSISAESYESTCSTACKWHQLITSLNS